ncbi:FAST kinase domain-containing protein 1, mitochondrial [Pseudochaenichthys georgianus]|uniref:FAST kinase domain-containing protein 1, mitochondrial n=1 Tax=Pseudochaenichthys georgianus TaxID=52239 RepID=UPI00146D7EEC|nr:FAST kinase domain-containing protein 1, mitochondrial [Pseudochaenichthys georgianus]
MFRLRCGSSFLRRLLHGGTVNRDQVLQQLQVCAAEDQVLDVVGKNKAKLTVNHVSTAVGMLWQFQREKPQMLRTVMVIRCHPQFLTLRVLAENKIALMDDLTLVDMLYSFLRFNVDGHDSLVQQLVSEAWLRIDRLPMESLSKFSMCLSDLNLQNSPLMGHITSIVDQRLSSIDDARILTSLMISMSPLVSPRLRDALISRAEELLDTMDPAKFNNPRRIVQFMRNIKHSYRPLLDKCNKIILINMSRLDAENICMIMGLYQGLQFNSCDFNLAVKPRLTELIDSSTDPHSFTKLFVALAPMASQEIRDGLENTALLLADELTPHQALAVAEALQYIQSRNLNLLNKIASVIQRNLHVYKPVEVTRFIQALFQLKYQNPELYAKLRQILLKFMVRSVQPYEVTMLIRVLSMLPCQRLEDGVISRVEAIVTQCKLNDLNTISIAVAKWLRNDPSYRHNTSSKCVRLLQTLNRCGRERLQKADRLDLLLEELKYTTGEWFEEMLLDETMVTLKRMMDQIHWTNVPALCHFLTKINHICPPLLDRIATVAIKDIDKIHHWGIYATILPFSVLNYDSANELYDASIQCVTAHISTFEPHMLVLLGYTLALADYFPEALVREIFSIEFLGKLDAELENLSDALTMRARLRLMELNRAVCIECPEYQVPWFHENYCQQFQKQGTVTASPMQQQIHNMLGEVLGGINCVRVAVVTPYFYTVDFECVLDKRLQPLPYSEPSTLQISDRGKVHWGTSSEDTTRDVLPPGAQRVAVNFLDSKSFCKNSHHLRGNALMKKRHLEILGYLVVQVPHFEWNSMELSTPNAWKEYLKKNLFGQLSS